MSDTSTTTTEETEVQETEVPPVETEVEETPGEKPPADPLAELPDWAQTEIKKVRGEAANYRTQLREAQKALESAKTPEEYEAAVSALSQKNAELERNLLVSNVAREFELPADLAELLKGDDEAALKAHAKTLQKYAQSSGSPESLSGGLTPDDSAEFDPVAEAKKARARRY